jgi:hypothetical protein
MPAMAKPAKRRINSDDAATSEADPTDSTNSTDSTSGATGAMGPPKAAGKPKDGAQVTSRRITPAKGSAPASGRSTRTHRPSPPWVPVLMFALWGLGLLVIILNYMQILPGAEDGGNGWYLVAGLGSILGGIIVATQYR